MGAIAAGQLAHPLDAFVTPLGHHVGGPELTPQIGAILVPAHQNDPFSTKALGGQHRREADGTVADDRHRSPRANPGGHRAVVTGREHVGQREQRREQG